MSQEEFSSILKSYYGEDLGYNSDDAEYEYFPKLKTKASANALTDLLSGKNKKNNLMIDFLFHKTVHFHF
jgi:hypothetical protein